MDKLRKIKEETKNISLLYVEDDMSTRNQFLELFNILFDDVEIAVDGKDALEKYILKKHDVVITDINMPNMDGLELTKILREINEFQKIIIVSAHDSSKYLLESISLNIDDFILKPVDINQLERVLLKICHAVHAEKLLSSYHEELEHELELKTAKLVTQLVTDDLTNLLNRKALNMILKMNKNQVFVLCNIDNFDSMNITYGYSNGDLIIKYIARFIEKHLPQNTTLYYLNADEFAVVFGDIPIEEAKEFAINLQTSAMKNTIEIEQFKIKFTLTIAISQGKESLFRNAHIAFKDARDKGPNRIAFYDENSPIERLQSNIQEYMPILRMAVAKRQITPYFQAIINNKTKKIEKFESLARIIDDNNTIHQPVSFIKIAELTGMIPDITRIMIDKTFASFKDNHFQFSINISEHDLNDKYLVGYLKKNLDKYNIDPSRVVIEILEGASSIRIKEEINQVQLLKNLGLSIAIDDFGAENSNFERVHGMNIDFIKIDGSFIKNIDTNKKSYSIVKTIADFAKSIGAEAIAEFVHSEDVFNIVNELGIKYSQGYYFAEPREDIIYEI